MTKTILGRNKSNRFFGAPSICKSSWSSLPRILIDKVIFAVLDVWPDRSYSLFLTESFFINVSKSRGYTVHKIWSL